VAAIRAGATADSVESSTLDSKRQAARPLPRRRHEGPGGGGRMLRRRARRDSRGGCTTPPGWPRRPPRHRSGCGPRAQAHLRADEPVADREQRRSADLWQEAPRPSSAPYPQAVPPGRRGRHVGALTLLTKRVAAAAQLVPLQKRDDEVEFVLPPHRPTCSSRVERRPGGTTAPQLPVARARDHCSRARGHLPTPDHRRLTTARSSSSTGRPAASTLASSASPWTSR